MRSLIMRGLTAATCAAAMLCFGVAKAGETQQAVSTAPAYVVIRENATIPFARTIYAWEVGRDDSLLLRAGVNRWYRARIDRQCANDLRFQQHLAVTELGPSIDKFAHFYVRGRYCYLYSLDQIENPHPRNRS